MCTIPSVAEVIIKLPAFTVTSDAPSIVRASVSVPATEVITFTDPPVPDAVSPP